MHRTVYQGHRTPDGVCVTITSATGTRPFTPDWSQKIYNHSPDGFNWGYYGSGPAQLALAILLEHFIETDDAHVAIAKARKYYQHFKVEFVAKFDEAGWQVTDSEIDAFINTLEPLPAEALQ
jgi:hypothetical protein